LVLNESAHPEEIKTGVFKSGENTVRIPDIWHYWIVFTSSFETLLDIFLKFFNFCVSVPLLIDIGFEMIHLFPTKSRISYLAESGLKRTTIMMVIMYKPRW